MNNLCVYYACSFFSLNLPKCTSHQLSVGDVEVWESKPALIEKPKKEKPRHAPYPKPERKQSESCEITVSCFLHTIFLAHLPLRKSSDWLGERERAPH